MKKPFSLSKHKGVICAMGFVGALMLSACSNLPDYREKVVKDAIEGEGLSMQLQQEAQERMKQMPILINAPALSFNLVTVDRGFDPHFAFVESDTGYIWNHYFTQRALVHQFIDNTLMGLKAMEIPVTAEKQRYELDATIIDVSFTSQNLKQRDLDRGYKAFILGRMETAYRIVDTQTRQTVFEQNYTITDTRYLPVPGQKAEVSAGLLYQMMTDSSIKFGQDIAKHCSFYRIPKIECQ